VATSAEEALSAAGAVSLEGAVVVEGAVSLGSADLVSPPGSGGGSAGASVGVVT
jgi:hypothetical protein